MSGKKVYSFDWGDTRGLREITLKKFFNFPLESNMIDWNKHGGYADDKGSESLLAETKKLIKSLTNHEYKYVLITAGATNALNAYLYAKKRQNLHIGDKPYVYTNQLYYRRYPQVIKNQDMIHLTNHTDFHPETEDLHIIDSPSNPKGDISVEIMEGSGRNVVWDAAYHSPTYYKAKNMLSPAHEAMIGSYSKYTSINGIRVGWLATDDEAIYDHAYNYVCGDACSVNSVGQELIARFLKTVDLEAFYKAGNDLLNDNKTELQKLSYMFEGGFTPKHGMFAFSEVDQAMLKLFNKAHVQFSNGRDLGADWDSVRINLANSREDTKAMVEAILKADNYY